MFDTIVIPTDGSESSALAFPYAERLPSSAVRLVRVEPNFQVLAPGPLENFRPDWREVRTDQIEQELAPIAERFRGQGREVDVVVRFGEPIEEIIAAAADADLIVMATQGAGTVGRALLGSVADGVARRTQVPALLVRATGQPAAVSSIARIVVPLDGSQLAEQALPFAGALARTLGVPIELVHVIEHGASGTDARDEARQALQARAQRLSAEGLDASALVLLGSPIDALIDALHPDDLAVMTTRGRGGLKRWLLGSVADRLVREAAAPVLLVPSRDDMPR